jgi:TonB family protein
VLCVLCGSVAVDAAAQEIKQAGTEVPPPKRTKFVAPTYPLEAQATGQRGIVILELVVDAQGKVESVNVVRSVPPFDESATAAVRQWEYEITRVDGRPVKVRLTVPITFALRLPTIQRAPGVPEMRMGAAPALPPEPWSRNEAVVEADVTLDPDGQVTDALVTAGDSPWAEALLQALRTWRFVGSPGEGPLTFKTTARFVSGASGGTARVDLSLSDPRRTAAAPPAEPGVGAEATTAPSPSPSPAVKTADALPAAPSGTPPATIPSGTATAPSPAPPTATAPVQPPATAPAQPPASTPATTPASPPAQAPPATTTAAPATKPPAAARPTIAGAEPQAPPIEVVPPAPPPPAPPEGGGGSAVRGIQLGAGVPDLVSGRRPVVPPLARLNTVAGKVLVRFAVDASGATSSAEAEGPEPLREAARQAVASWMFRRTKADRIRLAAEFDYGAETATAIVNVAPEK